MFTQLYLSFLLRKIYFYKLAFALKNYNKCCAPGQTGKQSVHNNVFSFASTFNSIKRNERRMGSKLVLMLIKSSRAAAKVKKLSRISVSLERFLIYQASISR